MTTKSDWEFRARYLRDSANEMDERAEKLRAEASRYRNLANMAEISATQVAEEGV